MVAAKILALSLGAACICVARADSTSGDLFFTQYTAHNVNKVSYSFDGASLSIGPISLIQHLPGADGVVFAKDGDLLVGGQGLNLYKVKPDGSGYSTSTTPGSSIFHVSLDPSGSVAWAGGIPGPLVEVPVSPLFGAAGTVHTVSLASGGTIGVDTIAFDANHGNAAYFTSSSSGGHGTFGTIDLTTFIATAIVTSKESAHGLAFDSFTGDFILFGDNQISSYDPVSGTFIDRSFSNATTFDQGAVDGKGHIFAADNGGELWFVDYSASGDLNDASTVIDHLFLADNLDDIAPLSGVGSHPTPDAATTAILLAMSLLGLIGFSRRCAQQQA